MTAGQARAAASRDLAGAADQLRELVDAWPEKLVLEKSRAAADEAHAILQEAARELDASLERRAQKRAMV